MRMDIARIFRFFKRSKATCGQGIRSSRCNVYETKDQLPPIKDVTLNETLLSSENLKTSLPITRLTNYPKPIVTGRASGYLGSCNTAFTH